MDDSEPRRRFTERVPHMGIPNVRRGVVNFESPDDLRRETNRDFSRINGTVHTEMSRVLRKGTET
jgi:hypothetical protein